MRRGAASPTHRRAVQAEERRREILRLRLAGLSFRQIAQQMGMSVGGVHKLLMAYLKSIPYEDIETLRRLELERLDVATMLAMKRIEEGDLAGIDRLVRIIDTRMRITGGYQVQAVDATQPIQLVWPEELAPGGTE